MLEKKSPLRKIADFIIKSRFVIIGIFAALVIVSAVMIPKVQVNYDLSKYLPTDSDAAKAIEIMNEEFAESGSVLVMVKNITEAGAEALAGELNAIDGVKNVSFDKAADFKDGNALFHIATSHGVYDERTNSAVGEIIDALKDKEAYVTGEAAGSYYTRKNVQDEVFLITIIVAVAVAAILIFTSKSFFELVVFLLVFGVAAIINMGTNFLLGEISFITNSIAIVLQLALAIDYSIILLHRYLDERKNHPNREAVGLALKKAIPEVLSSGLTTVAGLCALMFMRLSIGFDLGLALSKGIIISMLTVFLVMPALLLWTGGLIEKTRHRSFVPRVKKPAGAILKGRKAIAPIFLAIVIAACSAQFFTEYTFNNNSGNDIVTANNEIKATYGTYYNSVAVLVPKGDYAKEASLISFAEGLDGFESVTALSAIEIAPGMTLTTSLTPAGFSAAAAGMGMGGLISPFMAQMLYTQYRTAVDPTATGDIAEYEVAFIDMLEYLSGYLGSMENPGAIGVTDEMLAALASLTAARAEFEGETWSRLIFNIDAVVESDEAFAFLDAFTTGAKEIYPDVLITGESAVIADMSDAFSIDNTVVTVVTVAFILVILLFTFRSLSIPILLVLAILGSVFINFAIPVLMGNPINFIGYLVVLAIQMGATIDYAIILTNRYREHRASMPGHKTEAMAEAVDKVFPTVITSGSILTLAGFILGIVSSEPVVSGLGYLLGAGALISMLAVLFVLPSMLTVSDKIIEKTTLKPRKKKALVIEGAGGGGDIIVESVDAVEESPKSEETKKKE